MSGNGSTGMSISMRMKTSLTTRVPNGLPGMSSRLDHKWGTHLAVAGIIFNTLADLNVAYPTVSDAAKKELLLAKKDLEEEDGRQGAGKDTKKNKKKRK